MKLSSDFWRGFATLGFLVAAYQDHLGLDAYIEQCKKGWTEMPHWMTYVWLLAAGFCLGWRGDKSDKP